MRSVTSERAVDLLAELLSGPVLAPGDPGYDEARRVHNGMAARSYANYLPADDYDRVREAYGRNYDRLVELERRYDPGNLFRLSHNTTSTPRSDGSATPSAREPGARLGARPAQEPDPHV